MNKNKKRNALFHKKTLQQLGSTLIVGAVFLSVLTLPNFVMPSGQTFSDSSQMLMDPFPPVPDSLVHGSDDLPGFLEGKETEPSVLPTEPQPEETETETETETVAEETIPEETSPDSPDSAPEAEDKMLLSELSTEAFYYAQDVLPLTAEQQEIVFEIACTYGLPIELFYGIMCAESHYTPDVISASDDYGIMQINKCNHAWLNRAIGAEDFLDYETNVRCGGHILNILAQDYQEIPQILMCYNRGEDGAKKAWEDGLVFDRYCERVTAEMNRLLGIRNAEPA